MAEHLIQVVQKQGLEFKLGQKVTGTERNGDRVTLKYESVKDGSASEIEADIVLVSTGRRPLTGAPLRSPCCPCLCFSACPLQLLC